MWQDPQPPKIDYKNIAIAILIIVALVQAFFLLRPKKTVVVHKKIKAAALKPKPAQKPVVGKIAIIIDDWGYNAQLCENLSTIDVPLAVSILPDLPYTADVNRCATRLGKEIMLHMPMEPHEMLEKYPEGYFLKTSMSESEIRKSLNDALDNVPGVTGINNHTGSKATEDPRFMKIVLGILKEKNLFFVDSLVTSHSVCPEIADQIRLPFAQRDVFLDNENERAYIENQFALLAQKAREEGYALAIGHARKLTLQIIREQAEILKNQGFQFITVKSLIKRR